MNDPVILATERQRAAADPATDAFVIANAGTGKTKVLVDRVTRLLLRDAKLVGSDGEVAGNLGEKGRDGEVAGNLGEVMERSPETWLYSNRITVTI